MTPGAFDTEGAARYCAASPEKILSAVSRRELAQATLDGEPRFSRADLDAWIARWPRQTRVDRLNDGLRPGERLALTLRDACRLTSLGEGMIKYHVQEGHLRARRTRNQHGQPTGHYLFLRKDIEEFLERLPDA